MIEIINKFLSGDMSILKANKWLFYIAFSADKRINYEHVNALQDINENPVLDYVLRTLSVLDNKVCRYKSLIGKTLVWSEVAKGGLNSTRANWEKKGYNLFAHNEGSADIYLEERPDDSDKEIVSVLIRTHGLIGQSIRGEVPFSHNIMLYLLVENGLIKMDELSELLHVLNECIIRGVSDSLWEKLKIPVSNCIGNIVNGRFTEYTLEKRVEMLRQTSISNGENFAEEYKKHITPHEHQMSKVVFERELWYVEAALSDFSLEEFVKIFLLINSGGTIFRHISFEKLMKSLYYDYKQKKTVNLYMKRIIEKYLRSITVQEILSGKLEPNKDVSTDISAANDIVRFNFNFSDVAEKLTAFCLAAENGGALYEKAIMILFDMFELRRDRFDRFHNEEKYLQQMNSSINHKQLLLDYIVGDHVVDIGPGGGALMDLIAERFPNMSVTGIDFSVNVVDVLTKRKISEGKTWNVIYGDALNLGDISGIGKIDTIIFCSVLHELFSYIPYNGKRFNTDTVKTALKSAFDVLNTRGRIIIRDGIMSDMSNEKRIIRFNSSDGIRFLQSYVKDFKGRKIAYDVVGQNEIIMPVNDAMEFLYTYTWGEESYAHEVEEQFGYFTPNGYRKAIEETLGKNARIIELKNFLQQGYEDALLPKISIFDENRKPVKLPDSTCIVVIEKIK